MTISKFKKSIKITISKETYDRLKLRFNNKTGTRQNTISVYLEKLIEKDFEEDDEWEKYK